MGVWRWSQAVAGGSGERRRYSCPQQEPA